MATIQGTQKQGALKTKAVAAPHMLSAKGCAAYPKEMQQREARRVLIKHLL